MPERAVCSVSVDLDPISCYQRIHGMAASAPDLSQPDPVYTHALPRLLSLFHAENVHATFFVIAQDLACPAHVELLQRAVEEGHELGSHTHTHPYNLPDLDPARLDDELTRAHDLITQVAGSPPVGFRAPGYNIDARTISRLASLGYTYDSSVFPCPPYYLAKAAVMGLLWLLRRPSGSSLIDWHTQTSPLTPYHPSREAVWKRASSPGDASPLVELPMCVLPGSRIPLIGTSALMMGPKIAAHAFRQASLFHRDFIGFELHGIDAIDPERDPIDPALRRRQPDLRYSWDHKARTLRACFQALQARYVFAPCRVAAQQWPALA